MENLKKFQPYHYLECGLDNVYLHNVPRTKDVKGEEVICMLKINKLHKAIAEGIITKQGPLTGKEICFLRTFLGESLEGFSRLIGKDISELEDWEKCVSIPDATTDILIRTIVKEKESLIKIDGGEIADNVAKKVKKKSALDIYCDEGEYIPYKKCA